MKSGEFRHTAFMPVSFRYSVKIAEVSSSPCAMIVRSEVYSRNAPTSLRISSKAAFIRPRASSRCAPSTPSMQVVYLSVNIARRLSTVSVSGCGCRHDLHQSVGRARHRRQHRDPRSFVTDYFGYFLHIRGRTHRRASNFNTLIIKTINKL